MKSSTSQLISENIRVIFLGAGRPDKGKEHPALRETLEGSRVLDWLLQAYPKNAVDKQFIGGYKFNELINNHENLRYLENRDWEETGPVGSLFKAELPKDGVLFVSYSDTLYRSNTVQQLMMHIDI